MKLFWCVLSVIISTGAFAQNKTDSVVVLPIKIAAPPGAKKIGEIKMGDNAFKVNCDYEKIIEEVKKEAIGMGGNIVKITKLIEPVFISKCYKVEADVYYAAQMPVYHKENGAQGSIPGNENYAILYIYRLRDTIVPEPFYKMHLDGDSVICTVRSKTRESFKIYKEGPLTLWAKTDERKELKVDIKFGEVYYIRCGVIESQLWMSPVLELVDKKEGAKEYGKPREGKKDVDVQYLQQIH